MEEIFYQLAEKPHLWRRFFISLKILLDTNFLLIPAQFGIDIFQEMDRLISQKFEIIIFPGIVEELNTLSKESLKRHKEVSMTLEFVKKCKIIELNPELLALRNIDEIILRSAVLNKWIVATNDRGLRKKLRFNKVPVITLREKTHLILEGDIPS